MNTLYKIEIFAAIFGILVVGMIMLPTPLTFTGYVSGLNLTIYSQNLDLWIDGSQSYTLTTGNGNLNLKSFMLDGEVIGKGRVEILLDNGKGQQLLVYENVQRTSEFKGPSITGIVPRGGITGKSIDGSSDTVTEKNGVWLAIQPKKIMNYEFTQLNQDEDIVEGEFYSVCAETCNMKENIFNSASYELVFRIEKGTAVRLKEIKYILQD